MSKHTGLNLRRPKKHQWRAGSGKARARFGGDLNPSGDWSAHTPPFEPQSRPGFDPQSCAVEHIIRGYITLARYQGFTDFVPDGSERYTGAFAGTGPQGTDPYDVLEAVFETGLVPQEVMPWTDQMTFDAYYDKAMAYLNLRLGEEVLRRFEFGGEWIFPFGSRLSPEKKADRLREYRRRGAVCVSVSGNYRYRNEKLWKPKGEKDTHLVLLQKEGEINDSYEPQIKQLSRNYDHSAALVLFLKRREAGASRTIWAIIWDNFKTLWNGS